MTAAVHAHARAVTLRVSSRTAAACLSIATVRRLANVSASTSDVQLRELPDVPGLRHVRLASARNNAAQGYVDNLGDVHAGSGASVRSDGGVSITAVSFQSPGLHARSPQAEDVDVRARPLYSTPRRPRQRARSRKTQRADATRTNWRAKFAHGARRTVWIEASWGRPTVPTSAVVKFPVTPSVVAWSGRRSGSAAQYFTVIPSRALSPTAIRPRRQHHEELLPGPRPLWDGGFAVMVSGGFLAVHCDSSLIARQRAADASAEARIHRTAVTAPASTRNGVVISNAKGTKMVPFKLELPHGGRKNAARVSIEHIDAIRVTGAISDRLEGRDHHVHCDALEVGIPLQVDRRGRRCSTLHGNLVQAPSVAEYVLFFPAVARKCHRIFGSVYVVV